MKNIKKMEEKRYIGIKANGLLLSATQKKNKENISKPISRQTDNII